MFNSDSINKGFRMIACDAPQLPIQTNAIANGSKHNLQNTFSSLCLSVLGVISNCLEHISMTRTYASGAAK